MKLEQPGPAVEVRWVDSTGHQGWHSPEEAEESLEKMQCLCVGYLLHDKPEGIVIALGAGGLGSRLDSMAIPRQAIISVRYLDKKPKMA